MIPFNTNKKQVACIMAAAIASAVLLAVVFLFSRTRARSTSSDDDNTIPTSPRPHIIYILADDMGWNDVSFHGSDQIFTPNLDALAFNGIILNRHYVQPVCTPSRAALMTGKYPIHLGIQGEPLYGSERRGLSLDEKLLPQYLKDLGYTNRVVGKWHLGYYKLDFTPLRRGFDSHLGYWNGAISYYDHILQEIGNSSFNGHDFKDNNRTAWEYQGKYATDIFTEEAEHIIQNHNASTPLFLYLSHLAVHAGNEGKWLEAPQEVINKYHFIPDPNRRTYAAMVDKLDESIGRVVNALEKKKMLQNSIIVFVSDNGAPITTTFKNFGSNLPFRGEKATLWEGSVRTPALIWSPLIESSARVSNQLMHMSDWLPTLITAAGGDAEVLPKDLDGVDMWSTLSSNATSPRDQLLVNINEVTNYGSLILTNNGTTKGGMYKLILGKAPYGSSDYLKMYDTEVAPKYSPDKVLSSPVHTAISKVKSGNYSNTWVNRTTIFMLRTQATIRCTPVQNESFCEKCLFDLEKDPCETDNLYNRIEFSSLVSSATDSYNSLLKTLVPQPPKFLDPKANPAFFNYTWSAWVE